MRMDLSREEETKMLSSKSLGPTPRSASQNELIERTGCSIQPINLMDLNNNQSKAFKSINKALLEFRFDKIEEFLPESETNEHKVVTNEYGSGELSLEDRLKKFDKEVIRNECPDTPEKHRLMRPKMLEMLLEHEPTNLVEFAERIPRYFRKPMEALNPKNPDCQSKFIKDIVNIIEEFGEK